MNEPSPPQAADFFITGGTLRADAPSYIARQADEDLYAALSSGEYCYVLTSRQMGKSSLMVRTATRLAQDGVSVGVVDLTAIGQNVTVEQWYEGLLLEIGDKLDIEDALEEFWEENLSLGPLQRWTRAVSEVVLPAITGRIVLFIDEIDVVQSLPFSTNEFFAAIREFYTRCSLAMFCRAASSNETPHALQTAERYQSTSPASSITRRVASPSRPSSPIAVSSPVALPDAHHAFLTILASSPASPARARAE